MKTLEELVAFENEIDAELHALATKEKFIHQPITDGVIAAAAYLVSRPKILWILKEPWEEIEEGVEAGGWSVTKDVAASLKSNRGALPMIGRIAHSVFNGGLEWQQVPWVTDDPCVRESLSRIAIINVSKFPGKKVSNACFLRKQFEIFGPLLKKQIDGLAPDVIIGGATLWLFYATLGLAKDLFDQSRSAWFYKRDDRLYIDAYHPAQRNTVPKDDYFRDIVEIIIENCAAIPSR